MMLAVRGLVLVAFVAVLVPAAASGAGTVSFFRTPSGNIGCAYDVGVGPRPGLRCDIRTGLRPRPPRPSDCDLDWGDSYELAPRGRAQIVCHGDTAILPRSHVLRYGSTWKRSGFACTSRLSGLRCRNASGHGFFLSKQHSYRF
jgi:hypothetical protein